MVYAIASGTGRDFVSIAGFAPTITVADSPLQSFRNQVSSDWEALTPPDRTTVKYHEVDGARFLAGSAGARSFTFDVPERSEPIGQAGCAATQVDWIQPIQVRIPKRGRSEAGHVDAANNEINLLARRIELRGAWPTGVLEVHTEEAVPDRDEETKGDTVYVLTCRVLCNETGS